LTGLSGLIVASILAPVCIALAQTASDPSVEAAECAARLRAASQADTAPNVPRLADVCADFAAQLDSGAWGGALGSGGADDLSVRSFEELIDLIEHYERAPRGTQLVVDDLAAVVESLRPFEPVAELTLWERTRKWIRARLGFDDPARGGGLLDWLRNLSVPDDWIRTIVYVLGITIVIAALVVLVNELRISGVLGGSRGSARVRGGTAFVPAWAKRVPLTYDGVRRAPPASQPALLLELLVERLRARYGDAVRDSFTHRELADAAGALGVQRRSELDAVVAAAERVTFAGWHPEPVDVEPVISQGKAVLDELEAEREPASSGQR
jgi:hypothetical protein